MGILLSRAIFDVHQPVNGLARITKQFKPEDNSIRLSTATPPTDRNDTLPQKQQDSELPTDNEAVTEVLIGSAAASSPLVVVNTPQGHRVISATNSENESRPKTLEEELGPVMKRPLFVGVVTSKQLLWSRGMAINDTWGHQLGSNILFFSSEHTQSPPNLPVVSLPGTDDTYPPQKKVYRMLKYMYDHFINNYNWFMRADDDLYVRVDRLIEFLNSLDPSTDLYIGQPGIGKADDWDRSQLYPDEHYCMGGPGVIMSRSLLVKLGPHLDECLNNVVVSWNEDLEVGRCIMRRLGVQCTWNYQVGVCVCVCRFEMLLALTIAKLPPPYQMYMNSHGSYCACWSVSLATDRVHKPLHREIISVSVCLHTLTKVA